MEERKEIWKYDFPMKKGQFDDDYYFYSDGTIVHEFDLSVSKYNLRNVVSYSDIPLHKREIMCNACPENLKDFIRQILNLNKK